MSENRSDKKGLEFTPDQAGVVLGYNAYRDGAKERLEAHAQANTCPFCPDGLQKRKSPVEEKQQGWFVTSNDFPYPETDHHLLVIPERHVGSIDEIEVADIIAIRDLLKAVFAKRDIDTAAFIMRFGDPALNGSTVRHVHAHVVVPKKGIAFEDKKEIRFNIGSSSPELPDPDEEIRAHETTAEIAAQTDGKRGVFDIRHNPSPFAGTAHHVLLKQDKVARPCDFSDEDVTALRNAFRELVASLMIQGGGIVIPIGQLNLNGKIRMATEAHVVVPYRDPRVQKGFVRLCIK